MKKIAYLLFFAIVSIPYSFNWGVNSISALYYQTKPFIYRQLVPALSRYIPYEYLVLVSCVGLGMTMFYLYERYWKTSLRNDIALILSFAFVIIILEAYKKYYDVPTAFLFLLTVTLWMEKKYLVAIPVFTLLCLNRETAILLMPFVLFWRKWGYAILLGVIFGLTRLMILWVYMDAQGSSVQWNFWRSIFTYAEHPYMTLALIGTFSILALLFLYNFKNIQVPMFMYVLYILPVLIMLYVFAGYAFEVRVFAEVMPLWFMGAFLKGE